MVTDKPDTLGGTPLIVVAVNDASAERKPRLSIAFTLSEYGVFSLRPVNVYVATLADEVRTPFLNTS